MWWLHPSDQTEPNGSHGHVMSMTLGFKFLHESGRTSHIQTKAPIFLLPLPILRNVLSRVSARACVFACTVFASQILLYMFF